MPLSQYSFALQEGATEKARKQGIRRRRRNEEGKA